MKTKLSQDEEKVLATIRRRFECGIGEYGHLDLDADSRDFIQETMQEVLDMALYIAMKLERIRNIEEKLSENIGAKKD